MKKALLPLVIAAAAITCSAQSKISAPGRIMLEDFNAIVDSPYATDAEQSRAVSSFVILTDEGSPEMLEDLGLTVLSSIDNLAIIRLPLDRADEIAALPWVRQLDFGTLLTPNLNFARSSADVPAVQEGFSYQGTNMSFDGTGVVCGMMDTGLDPNHINFKNSDGQNRIQRLFDMYSYDGSSRVYTSTTIPASWTDTNTESHATHVAGIIGGSYKGSANYYFLTTPSGTTATNYIDNAGEMPYYGVATGADLAFAAGELYTDNITMGVQNIIEYAESVGKPCVVNLSLGHTSGPHDGTDAYTQYLSKLGKRGIICMSAGNDGDMPISIQKSFSSATNGKYVMFAVGRNVTLNGETAIRPNYANGVVDIWSNNSTGFAVKVGIVGSDNSFTEIFNVPANTVVSTSTSSVTAFTSKFYGTIQIITGVDSNNNRYRCYLRFSSVSPRSTLGTGEYLAVYLEGQAGNRAFIYGSTGAVFPRVSFKATIDGSSKSTTAGNASNSINDGVCGDNVISVGAYVSRTTWGRLDKQIYGYNSDYTVGDIAPFSSYGKTFQNKQLPLVTGPGAMIISSYSTPYLNANTAELTGMCAKTTSDGTTYYWGTMNGTSMSCPFVTGTIGLWLQADPTLTFDKVMEVINNTSTTDDYTISAPTRFGAGKINALAGMQYVLANRAAIGEVWADDESRLILNPAPGSLEVFVAGETALTVTVVDVQGRTVATASASADSLILPTGSIASGIYIVQAQGKTGRYTRKIAL
ncbi:MAG: S8 family peptidase [Muribaculaceae bacterium]|nr:S8 family peptidase [Muribaculaceae bacterium]